MWDLRYCRLKGIFNHVLLFRGAQDLLLRRILCHSLLGSSERAIEELEKASWLIPHEATGRLIAAVVFSKAGKVAEANTAFQQAGE